MVSRCALSAQLDRSFVVINLSRLNAKCYTTAMFAEPCPVRILALSSLKVTSSAYCNEFSIAQRARMIVAASSAVMKREICRR